MTPEFDYLTASIYDLSLAVVVGCLLFLIWFRITTQQLRWVLPSIVAGGLLVYAYTDDQLTQRYQDSLQQQVNSALMDTGQRLEGALEARLVEARAVTAHLAANPDIDQEDYSAFLERLLDQADLYTNFAAARDLTIDLVFPVEGNEPALGLYYPDVPSQWPMIQVALETRAPVLIGPIDLVQGGTGFIIHQGVFTNNGDLWGVIASVLPLTGILQASGVMTLAEHYYVAVYADSERLGTGPTLAWRSDETLPQDWASHSTRVPNGTWTLQVEPRHDIVLPLGVRLTIGVTVGLLILVSVTITLLLARSREQSRRARKSLQTTAFMLDEAQRIGAMGSWSQTPGANVCTLSPYLQQLMEAPAIMPVTEWERRIPGPEGIEVRRHLDQLSRGEIGFISLEHSLQTSRGTLTVQHTAESGRSQDGTDQLIIGNLLDITDKKATERKLEHLAYFDALTHIPNRFHFKQRLEQMLADHRTHNHRLAVLHIDLDHFKDINDSLGHQVGDEVLRIVSHRITSALKPDDLLARTGGDEFMAVLPSLQHADHAAYVARRIIDKLSTPMSALSHEIFMGISIGIALFPDHARDYEAMYQCADLALYRAKALGRGSFQIYADHLAEDFNRRTQLESALRQAIDLDELYLEYQPRFRADNGQITGIEALLRWRSERFGQIAPDEFIPIAEESGQIVPLGRWVLDRALTEFSACMHRLPPDITLSINLSPRQIQSSDLDEDILLAMRLHNMPGERLDLEITETFIVEDYVDCERFMQRLTAHGVTFSLDDFGTGYSNLVSLSNLPLAALKIDKSFVRDLADRSNHLAIVEAIIQLGHNLDMRVVAEGVEDEQQLACLQQLHCDETQGYYHARPQAMQSLCERFSQADV
ncbi:EAL domain-containing protein [Natronospirillum operosum]|uniref:EAL domain-containing protein n=1 Tax=Natronospirillum operosum TaxID=2759953 RepID=A0A4Z0WI12_9GAMM|nr:EAL domain-containing protein [Natronospirillum operosum]TGG95013.1 EAL domain-containing protein [Natronospirillum operosum]